MKTEEKNKPTSQFAGSMFMKWIHVFSVHKIYCLLRHVLELHKC